MCIMEYMVKMMKSMGSLWRKYWKSKPYESEQMVYVYVYMCVYYGINGVDIPYPLMVKRMKFMGNLWRNYRKSMGNFWRIVPMFFWGIPSGKLSLNYGKIHHAIYGNTHELGLGHVQML